MRRRERVAVAVTRLILKAAGLEHSVLSQRRAPDNTVQISLSPGGDGTFPVKTAAQIADQLRWHGRQM